MEAETIIAAVVPIVISAVAYGMQSKEVERLRSDLSDANDLCGEIEESRRRGEAKLYELHRQQDREISDLRGGKDRLERLETALERLDTDSRKQGSQVQELSIQMAQVFDKLRELNHGIRDILSKVDAQVGIKLETEMKIDQLITAIKEQKK